MNKLSLAVVLLVVSASTHAISSLSFSTEVKDLHECGIQWTNKQGSLRFQDYDGDGRMVNGTFLTSDSQAVTSVKLVSTSAVEGDLDADSGMFYMFFDGTDQRYLNWGSPTTVHGQWNSGTVFEMDAISHQSTTDLQDKVQTIEATLEISCSPIEN